MTPEQLAAIRNRADLARSIAHGPNALWRALASADDVPALLAEIERLTAALRRSTVHDNWAANVLAEPTPQAVTQ